MKEKTAGQSPAHVLSEKENSPPVVLLSAGQLVPSIGKASVENALKKLVEDGIIRRHGKGKATFYTRADCSD